MILHVLIEDVSRGKVRGKTLTGNLRTFRLPRSIEVEYRDGPDDYWGGPRWVLRRKGELEDLLTLHVGQLVCLDALGRAVSEAQRPGSTMEMIAKAAMGT